MDTDKKYKIFIIDDDNFLLDMYSTKFSQSNFDVEVSSSAAEALDKLRKGFAPDIILVDIMMPIMDGFEFLKVANQEKICDGAIKIILSNLGLESDIAEGLKLGTDGYIIKASATPAEVVSRVMEIVASKKKQ